MGIPTASECTATPVTSPPTAVNCCLNPYSSFNGEEHNRQSSNSRSLFKLGNSRLQDFLVASMICHDNIIY